MAPQHYYPFHCLILQSNLTQLLLNLSRVDLEKRLLEEPGSQEKKNRQLQSLGRKESQFLRLRRTRLGLEDFITVKVIGKGAFGEVTLQNIYFRVSACLPCFT